MHVYNVHLGISYALALDIPKCMLQCSFDSMQCTTAGLENRIMHSLSDLLQKIAAGGGIQVPD